MIHALQCSNGNMVLSFHEFCWAQAKFKMSDLFHMKGKVEIAIQI